MESERFCRKCTQRVDANDHFIICKGDCAGTFHCHCVGLRGMQWKTINDLARNVLWMCDCCMDDFIHTKNGNSSNTCSSKQTIDEDVKELKNVVAGIMNTISTLTKSLPTAAAAATTKLTINSEVVHTTPDSFSLSNGTACDNTVYDDESDGFRNTGENDIFFSVTNEY